MAQRQIFISYARSDDATLPFSKNSKGFVTNVVEEMKTIFRMKYPAEDRPEFCNPFDEPEGFTARIVDNIARSAIMILILSRNWLSNYWCQQELMTFVRAYQDNAQGRIIAVAKHDVDDEFLPPVLKRVPQIKFFQRTESGLVQTFHDPESEDFRSSVKRLAEYVEATLLLADPVSAPPLLQYDATQLPSAVKTDRSSSEAAPAAAAEPVDAAVFCPSRVPKGSNFLVQVFLYSPHASATVARLAHQADEEAVRRGKYSLPIDLPSGTRVDLHLQMPRLTITDSDAVLIWRGKPTAAQFDVNVPVTVPDTATIGTVTFAAEGIPLGTLSFKVVFAAAGASTDVARQCEVTAVRYRRAFTSYSSQDRAEVLRRVQAFRIAGLCIFQDVLDLDPGERWERELYRQIDACDVFLLFWSHAAAASEWVAKEIQYALDRKGGSDEKPPAIQPVPIEGPPPVPPPEALKHLYFNDALLAHIKSAAIAP